MRVAFILLFFLSACQQHVAESDPIARVNGEVITVRDYLNLFESLKPKEVSLQGAEKARLKNMVLKTLVRRGVIITAAKKEDIKITDKELQEGIEKFKAGYSDYVFQESLLEGMIDEKEWEEQVRQTLLIEKLFEAKKINLEAPTLEEALDYYQTSPHLYQRAEEATALHLVVNDRDLAFELREKIAAKESLFLALAKEHSIGPEAKSNAQITVEKGTMPEPIDDFLFSDSSKNISPVIETEYGHHIFKVLSRRPAVNLDFKQVRNEIFEQLYEEKRLAWLQKFEESLIREADIEYNRKLIKSL